MTQDPDSLIPKQEPKTAVIEFTEWEAKSLLGYGGKDWAKQNASAIEKIRAECHKQWPIK